MSDTTVYSVGYTGFPYGELMAMVKTLSATLVDIRLKPYSRFQPHWNRKSLQAALGPQYLWLEELGNLNYKGGPIALKDADLGMTNLRLAMSRGPVIVMCACADPGECHRTVVTGMLVAAGLAAIEHLKSEGRRDRERRFKAETEQHPAPSARPGEPPTMPAVGRRSRTPLLD